MIFFLFSKKNTRTANEQPRHFITTIILVLFYPAQNVLALTKYHAIIHIETRHQFVPSLCDQLLTNKSPVKENNWYNSTTF